MVSQMATWCRKWLHGAQMVTMVSQMVANSRRKSGSFTSQMTLGALVRSQISVVQRGGTNRSKNPTKG